MKKIYCLFTMALLLITFSRISATQLTDDFTSQINAAQTEDEFTGTIMKYIPLAKTIEEYRTIQNYWLRSNHEQCEAYFLDLYQTNPDSGMYQYLWARCVEDPFKQLNAARRIIQKDPAFIYGYRLLTSIYVSNLFSPNEENDQLSDSLSTMLKSDEKYFTQYLEMEPDNENAIMANFYFHQYKHDVELAKVLLEKGKALKAPWYSLRLVGDFAAREKLLPYFYQTVSEEISNQIRSGKISPADSLESFGKWCFDVLFDNELSAEGVQLLESNPAFSELKFFYLYYAIIYKETGNLDKAFMYLEKALKERIVSVKQLTSETYFADMQKDARWDLMMSNVNVFLANSATQRKAELLADKFSKPAPLWELKDKEGSIVKLAEMKGDVVVLDFWATWCGPCQRTMPDLNNWMKTSMPKGVKVFSINVWEKEPSKALELFAKQGYAMTLLFGTNDLSKKYEFDGIPYICVIDKEGNVRYKQEGYSPDLDENLSFWVDDLLK